jgi:predicted CoA-binding protein
VGFSERAGALRERYDVGVEYREVLQQTSSILLIDYPGRVVPDTLARSGFDVIAHEGPGPEEYHRYSVDGDEITKSAGAGPPAAVDLVFSHRPLNELRPIVAEAVRVGARALWQHTGYTQDERREAEGVVTAAGLVYVDEPYILDAVAELRG